MILNHMLVHQLTLAANQCQPPGVETESAAFSRNTSMANDDVESAAIPGSTTPNPTVPTCGSPVSPIRELPELKDVMFQVGNTRGA